MLLFEDFGESLSKIMSFSVTIMFDIVYVVEIAKQIVAKACKGKKLSGQPANLFDTCNNAIVGLKRDIVQSQSPSFLTAVPDFVDGSVGGPRSSWVTEALVAKP